MKNRFLTIFVCIFLAVVLLAGGILAIVVGVKNAKSVIKYGNVTVDEETVNYLAAYYKLLYLKELNTSGIDAEDTPPFWQSKADGGVSYGEHFKRSFRDYLSSLVAAADVYISYAGYTADDREAVELTCEEILEYKAGGDVKTFNERCSKYGFTYDGFLKAAALLYKAQRTELVLYGEDGENLKNFPEECEKYFATYSHVSLLFLREETLIKTDEDGKYVLDENGEAVLRDMTEQERQQRLALAEKIRAEITAGTMTPEKFEAYLKQSDSDPAVREKGYYFNESAEATEEIAEEFADMVKSSLEMNIGEYREVKTPIGTCFIYKYKNTDGAYADEENPFFSDFYTDAVPYLYAEVLAELVGEVKFKDAYNEIDSLSIPKISEFYIREFKSAE